MRTLRSTLLAPFKHTIHCRVVVPNSVLPATDLTLGILIGKICGGRPWRLDLEEVAAFLSRVSQPPALAAPEGAWKQRFWALVRQAPRSAQGVPKALCCQQGLLTSLGRTGGAGPRCSGCLYEPLDLAPPCARGGTENTPQGQGTRCDSSQGAVTNGSGGGAVTEGPQALGRFPGRGPRVPAAGAPYRLVGTQSPRAAREHRGPQRGVSLSSS